MSVWKKFALATTGVVVVSLCVGTAQTALAAGRAPSEVILLGPQAKITRVVDGDTVEVNLNGKTAVVRYIGLDAPALNQCFGAAAKAANSALVAGQDVILQTDTTNVDANGQLPRYVYLVDGRMVNEELLKGGYAKASVALPDTKLQTSLNALEQAARSAGRGGWGGCGWKSTVARPAGACVTIEVAELMQRLPKTPKLNLLKDGDCVNVVKPVNASGGAWSGQFIYHPAGSTVKLTPGYVRWKDGFVPLVNDPDKTGQTLAIVDFNRRGPSVPVNTPFGTFFRPGPVHNFQVPLPLERDPADNAIVRLPSANTWILRDLGAGKFQALVDVFEYKSGDIRVPQVAANGEYY